MTSPHDPAPHGPGDENPFDQEAHFDDEAFPDDEGYLDDDGYELDDPARIAVFLGKTTVPHQPTAPTPVEWRTLSTSEARQQIRLLDAWVTWLVERYDLDARHIPDCWDRHSALIEELSALRTARALAYDPNTPGSEPLHWHERFAAARHRLTDWVARTGCRPGEHRP